MRYPSIDKLLLKVDSKYKLAIISAKRGRQLEQGSDSKLEKHRCVKPVGIALEEILEGKLEV